MKINLNSRVTANLAWFYGVGRFV